RGPLVTIADLCIPFPQEPVEEDRLEQVLREVEERRGRVAEVLVGLALIGETAELLAGEPGHPDDLRSIAGTRRRRAEARHVEPGSAADLERPRVDDVRLRGTMWPVAA